MWHSEQASIAPPPRRCLLTLSTLGYADYDGKYFTLAVRSLRLGLAGLSSMPLPHIVQPWLDKLSERIGQSCSVSILDGNEIVYVARAAQTRIMSIGLMPGSRLPVHCTSMGRVLVIILPEEEARSLIESCDLAPRTPFSLTDTEQILEEVALIRDSGYSLLDQEVEIGLRSIAIGLTGHRAQCVLPSCRGGGSPTTSHRSYRHVSTRTAESPKAGWPALP